MVSIFYRLGLGRVVIIKLHRFRSWAACEQWRAVAGYGV